MSEIHSLENEYRITKMNCQGNIYPLDLFCGIKKVPYCVRDAALPVLSQHVLKGFCSHECNAIGVSQGGTFGAEPTCESRFKTLQHTAWWGFLYVSLKIILTAVNYSARLYEEINLWEDEMVGKFILVINAGPDQGTEIPLEKTEITIGRDIKNDIAINDPEVSRQHARLLLRTNTYVIEDLGSTNGTFINNQRLTSPTPLKPGELIFLGENICLAFQSSFGEATIAAGGKRGETKVGFKIPPPLPKQKAGKVANPEIPSPDSNEPPRIQDNQQITPKKKISRWVWVVIIILLLILFVCIAPLFIIDATNSWCSIFGDILHGINPAVCIP
jgi:hypothetical protein